MAILLNPGGESISIKRNKSIGYPKESDYAEKSQNKQENVEKIAKITQDKLLPCLKKSAFTFHQNFYPEPKVKLEDVVISDEAKEKLQVLKQNYNNIVSQHSSGHLT